MGTSGYYSTFSLAFRVVVLLDYSMEHGNKSMTVAHLFVESRMNTEHVAA